MQNKIKRHKEFPKKHPKTAKLHVGLTTPFKHNLSNVQSIIVYQQVCNIPVNLFATQEVQNILNF